MKSNATDFNTIYDNAESDTLELMVDAIQDSFSDDVLELTKHASLADTEKHRVKAIELADKLQGIIERYLESRAEPV